MRNTVEGKIKLKVAGGVRNLDTMLRMHKRGAVRFGIGLASAISIMEEAFAFQEGIDLTKIEYNTYLISGCRQTPSPVLFFPLWIKNIFV